MTENLYIVGSAWMTVDDSTDLQLDEAVFETCSAALRDAGVRRHQVGFSVTSSLDLYDARSISTALTAPAAAGYLNDELRVEGDASGAIQMAAAGLASGNVDFAIVTTVHIPEVGSTAERAVRAIDERVSSYTFDSHLDRPVGMTAVATLGVHAASRLDNDTVSWQDMTERTAADINRGSAKRGVRQSVTIAQVAEAPIAVAPLTELMLPASSAGVGAIVLGAGIAGRRCPNPHARLAGLGSATGPSTANPRWLTDPGAPAERARKRAYASAGITDPGQQVGWLEMTDLSPALSTELRRALDLESLADERVNASGGVRSNHPGVANGLLRVIEATASLRDTGGAAVVHSADSLCGLVSSMTSVFVLKEPA